MSGKTAKLSRMVQKGRGCRVTVQMPDMTQEENMIPGLNLLYDICPYDGCGIAQDGQAMALQEQVPQCLV